MQPNSKHLLMLAALASMWAPSFLFIKLALQGFTPISLGFFRLLLAAALMYALMKGKGLSMPSTWKEWKYLAAMGITANAFPFVLFPFGEQMADSGAASIINGTTPIFTAILAHVFISSERMNKRSLLGILAGFSGMIVMFLPAVAERGYQRNSPWGLAAFGLAALFYSIAGIIAKKKLTKYHPLVASTGQFATAAAVLLPVAFFAESPLSLTPEPSAMLSVVVLAVVGTVAAYALYYHFLATASTTFVSLVTFLMPPLGLALGILFLNEQPAWYSFAGCTLILTSIFILNRSGDVFRQISVRLKIGKQPVPAGEEV